MATDTTLAKQPTNFEKIRALARSDEVLSRFVEVLGPSAPTFISSVLVAVQNNDRLMESTPNSIIRSAMRAATLKLSCDPALGQAWIVPYFNKNIKRYEAQFQIGYKGMNQLALRTGKYRYLNVAPVYEGQTVIEDQLRGIHTIAGFRASNKAIGFMLYFQLISGYEKTYYMTVEEIMAHGERYSQGFDRSDGFWKKQTVDMMKKTVFMAGLRRWGYFDPNDALGMGVTREDAQTEEEIDPDLDLEFTSANGKKTSEMSEAEIMHDLTGEPMPEEEQPAGDSPAEPATENTAEQPTTGTDEQQTEPKTEQPAETKAVVYTGDTIKIGNHKYPASWVRSLVKAKLTSYEVDGILQKLALNQATQPEEVVSEVQKHLRAKQAAQPAEAGQPELPA